MLSKRIIPCLDVRDGKLTKGIKFKGNIDIGDPVEMAAFYYEQGADEIVFYDITASSERRDIMIETVGKVAEKIFIPFSVGGGIRTVEDMRSVLLAAGARAASMTGSGPTLVGLFDTEQEARAADDLLCRREGVTSFVVHTLDTTELLKTRRDKATQL